MKRSVRVLIAGLLIEGLLAGIAWWLISGLQRGDFQAANSPAETISTITTVIGGAMGVVAALVLVMVIVLRRSGN
jgi:hypothetical protein